MALPTDKMPNLLTPTNLGAIEICNRIVMAPLTRGRSGPSRVPNEMNLRYYQQRAGDTGLIITEGTTISPGSNGWKDNAGIYTQDMADGWKPVVKAVHEKGAKFVLQLWHLGRAAHSSYLSEGERIVAPSPIAAQGDGVYASDGSKQPYEVPKEMSVEDIASVVEDFRKAASFAKDAGFDGVEIHSANGYLLDTFLQSSTNKRKDQYGGSVENRFRLLSEVLDAVCGVWGADRVAIRLSPNGAYNDMGSEDNIETFTYALKELDKRGLAYVHVMTGLGFGFHKKCAEFTPEMVRESFQGRLMLNVGYDRESAEAVVSAGTADCVSFGRPFIGNPDLVYRWAHDLPLAESDPSTWFTHDDIGYSDYPTYLESQADE
jgi:N-ethylmaleimide reductase